MRWRQHNFHLKDSAAVTLATKVFLVLIIVMTDATARQTTASDYEETEDVAANTIEEMEGSSSFYSFNTMSENFVSTLSPMTTGTGKASSTQQHKTVSDETSTPSSTTYQMPATTTLRPLIVPTLPELRHRTRPHPYLSKHHHEHHWGPFFEEPIENATLGTHVGVHLGTDTFLSCRVGMLRDKTVMWVRRTTDKVSLLTVGNNTYSGDPRISVKFQYPNNWRLHIDPVEMEDAGLYMCQVSTHPPRVFATNVTVLSPAIRVVDELGHEVNDRYYKVGSLIDLTCEVAVTFLATLPTVISGHHPYLSYNTKPDPATAASFAETDSPWETKYDYYHQHIIWRLNNKTLHNVTENNFNLSSTPEWRSSRLTIQHVDRTYSGIYSCSLLNITAAVVDVQILNGETPAAVQHNNATSIVNMKLLTILIFLFSIVNISVRSS